MRNLLIAFLLITLVATSVICSAPENEPSDDLQQLISYMSGSFSSREQSELDTNYYDIRLEMIPIWTERYDGYWLYVEQAVAGYEDKPYRQRVYHVTQPTDTSFVSEVYTIPEPLRFAQKYDDPDFFTSMTPDSLELRDGCAIHMRKVGDQFVGSTIDKDCESDLRGASFATSEVRVTGTFLYSWDRGYDSDGNQVWGAEDGGYRFNKIKADQEAAEH